MKTEKLDIRRRLVAYKTMTSWQEIPHVSYTYTPDATELWDYYKKVKLEFSKKDRRLTFNSFLIKIIAEALKEVPAMYSLFEVDENDMYAGEITEPDSINIGIPWTIPNKGMMTFTIRDVGNLTITEIMNKTEEISKKLENTDIDLLYKRIATEKFSEALPEEDKISPYDVAQSNITVSNIGSICRYPGRFDMLDVLSPQSCVIGISALQDDVRVIHNEIKAIKTLPITIVFDHRALDFGEIVPFMDKLDSYFKNPQLIESLL